MPGWMDYSILHGQRDYLTDVLMHDLGLVEQLIVLALTHHYGSVSRYSTEIDIIPIIDVS